MSKYRTFSFWRNKGQDIAKSKSNIVSSCLPPLYFNNSSFVDYYLNLQGIGEVFVCPLTLIKMTSPGQTQPVYT